MRYNIGEKVVCDNAPWAVNFKDMGGYPKRWDVLTIKETYDCEGLQLLWFSSSAEAEGFNSACFRPLHDEVVERIIKEVGQYPKNLR